MDVSWCDAGASAIDHDTSANGDIKVDVPTPTACRAPNEYEPASSHPRSTTTVSPQEYHTVEPEDSGVVARSAVNAHSIRYVASSEYTWSSAVTRNVLYTSDAFDAMIVAATLGGGSSSGARSVANSTHSDATTDPLPPVDVL